MLIFRTRGEVLLKWGRTLEIISYCAIAGGLIAAGIVNNDYKIRDSAGYFAIAGIVAFLCFKSWGHLCQAVGKMADIMEQKEIDKVNAETAAEKEKK